VKEDDGFTDFNEAKEEKSNDGFGNFGQHTSEKENEDGFNDFEKFEDP
jgi:hypothetical protein